MAALVNPQRVELKINARWLATDALKGYAGQIILESRAELTWRCHIGPGPWLDAGASLNPSLEASFLPKSSEK